MKYKYLDPGDFSSGDHGEISGYFATFHHDHGDSYGDVIRKGAEMLGWELDKLMEDTIQAMREYEDEIIAAMAQEI